MIPLYLFFIAFAMPISSDGVIYDSEELILQDDNPARPGHMTEFLKYVISLKHDLIHAGVSTVLPKGAAIIEDWCSRIIQALENPDASVKRGPRQLQHVVATLREVHSYILR